MPQPLVITSHRPQTGHELSRTLMEKYGVHAFSSSSPWPPGNEGELNRAVLNRQPTGLTCCIIERPQIESLVKILRELQPCGIVHSPQLGLSSHTSAVEEYQDTVNHTLIWLEAARLACPMVPFIHLSSTLVYGDRPNTIPKQELASRLEFADPAYAHGITESFPIEGSTHSLSGAAAVAADVLVQEYARSHHLPTCCLRLDAVCDPENGKEDRRDILSQIVHCCLTGTEYVVCGDQGRQVREIVSGGDVARLIDVFIQEPRAGEVYNVGGGKAGSCSIKEAIQWAENVTGKTVNRRHTDALPLGEPYCYFSDSRHLREHYPQWRITESWQELTQRAVKFQ